MLAVGVLPSIRIDERFTINGAGFFREVPMFAEGSRGFEVQLSPGIQIVPDDAWRVDLNHTWSRLWRTDDDSRFSTVNISRVRVHISLASRSSPE